jgi:hypothetical protein
MDSSIIDRDGECPRCNSKDIEREVILQTSMRVVSGAVFICKTCGLSRRALSSDREAWFNTHKAWRSPHVPETSWEEFEARWPKKVERPTYGRAEPIGPILPRPPER